MPRPASKAKGKAKAKAKAKAKPKRGGRKGTRFRGITKRLDRGFKVASSAPRRFRNAAIALGLK